MDNWLLPEECIDLIRQRANELIIDFVTLADAASRACGVFGHSIQEAEEALQKSFKQAEEQSIASVGTSPKKYGMSLRKHQRRTTMHYNYIPKPVKNQPYQRRTY